MHEIEALFNGVESGRVPVNDAQMEGAIKAAEKVVADMQEKAGKLSGTAHTHTHTYTSTHSLSASLSLTHTHTKTIIVCNHA